MCSRVCALGVLLVLILAFGMRAQQAQGAGTSPATEPAPTAASAPAPAAPATSKDDSAVTPPPPPADARKSANATPTSTSPPAAAQAKPTLADFAWLAGRWQGAWGPRVAQQVWMPPKGGVMLGTFQTVDNGATLVIELFSIIERPDGISLYFRHFTPTLEPWETSKPTLLKLASATPKSIEFDNPIDGQPKREIIRKIDADTYVSRAEIVPDKGDPQVVEITYHRQKEAVPAKH
ncbi:MAG: DUF6265 family protein [Candidatus Acidiferrales bacterium]